MADRVIGMLPISVGTSLAIEGLIDKGGLPIHNLALNIGTLFRNAYQAYETDDRPKLTSDILYKDVLQDLTGIFQNLKNISKVKEPKMVPYHCTYAGLARSFPKAKLWSPTTEKQKAYAELERLTTNKILTEMRGYIERVDFTIPKSTTNTYVITHHVVDLLTPSGTGDVTLLESHTGALKDKELWYTKLTNGNELKRIPFNKMTLSVFGDKSVNFKANGFKLRSAVMSTAEEYKWTPMTTHERIRLTLGYLKDKELASELLSMLV
ncbi:hypothetical protein ABN214_15420 [Proteus terrae]|uniref:hypothetical protein n=1 Tax=Proteus terrae TaxID=1574161 RepID=UPI0032DA92A4